MATVRFERTQFLPQYLADTVGRVAIEEHPGLGGHQDAEAHRRRAGIPAARGRHSRRRRIAEVDRDPVLLDVREDLQRVEELLQAGIA
jgi:hypothetical protein